MKSLGFLLRVPWKVTREGRHGQIRLEKLPLVAKRRWGAGGWAWELGGGQEAGQTSR